MRGMMFSGKIIFQESSLKDFKKDYVFVDMHVHTKYSHDCITPVSGLLKRAAKLGMGISIADHTRAQGALEACKQKRVMVIPAIEVASAENKEILLYFYSSKDLRDYYEKHIKKSVVIHKPPKSKFVKTISTVKSRMKMSEVIEKADKYSCLKCIPHPYTYLNRSSFLFFARKKRAGILKKIDAVEVFNSTHRSFMNNRALKWAVKRKKAFTGGSDAHILREVGSTVVVSRADTAQDFLDSIRKKQSFIIGQELKMPAAMKGMLKSIGYKRRKEWSKVYKF